MAHEPRLHQAGRQLAPAATPAHDLAGSDHGVWTGRYLICGHRWCPAGVFYGRDGRGFGATSEPSDTPSMQGAPKMSSNTIAPERPLTHDQSRTLFGQTMGLVAATAAA